MSQAQESQKRAQLLADLQAVRDLLTDPSHWAKGYFSFDKDNNEVCALSPESCSWCIRGAIQKVIGSNPIPAPSAIRLRRAWRAVTALEAVIDRPYDLRGKLASFNDDPRTNHEMVLDLIDRAISHAGSTPETAPTGHP